MIMISPSRMDFVSVLFVGQVWGKKNDGLSPERT